MATSWRYIRALQASTIWSAYAFHDLEPVSISRIDDRDFRVASRGLRTD
jgi:hypothetical protein